MQCYLVFYINNVTINKFTFNVFIILCAIITKYHRMSNLYRAEMYSVTVLLVKKSKTKASVAGPVIWEGPRLHSKMAPCCCILWREVGLCWPLVECESARQLHDYGMLL